jgi:hypothetical protein
MSRIVAAGAILACCAAFSGSAQAQPVTSLGGEPVNSLSVCSGTGISHRSAGGHLARLASARHDRDLDQPAAALLRPRLGPGDSVRGGRSSVGLHLVGHQDGQHEARMAGLEPASRDVAAQARLAALHEGWPRQSPRRPRPVSRLVDVPDPWFERARDHRLCRLLRMHPHDQRRCH